jgi:hypothetical protein
LEENKDGIPLHKQIDFLLRKLICKAESALDYNAHCFVYVYFRGQGIISSDFNETCAVAPLGYTIPLIRYAKMFATYPNVLTYFHLDCPRSQS